MEFNARLFISILYWSEEAFRIMVIPACHTNYTMKRKRFVHVGIGRFISVVTRINVTPLRPSLSNTLHGVRTRWNYQEGKMTWERSRQDSWCRSLDFHCTYKSHLLLWYAPQNKYSSISYMSLFTHFLPRHLRWTVQIETKVQAVFLDLAFGSCMRRMPRSSWAVVASVLWEGGCVHCNVLLKPIGILQSLSH